MQAKLIYFSWTVQIKSARLFYILYCFILIFLETKLHYLYDFILLCAVIHTNKLYTEAYLGIYANNFREPVIDLVAEILIFRTIHVWKNVCLLA